MAHQQLFRRGTAAQLTSFTPGTTEIVADTTSVCLRIGDSSQAGGFPIHKFAATHTTLVANALVYAASTTTLAVASTLTWDGTTLTVDGNISLVGASTISTSAGILTVTGTGGLTLSTAANTNLLLSPNGNGLVSVTKAISAIVGTGTATYAPAGLLYSSVTTVGNVGAGEDTLMSYTLPGGSLANTGDSVRITCRGDFTNNGNTKNLKFYFGSDVPYQTSAIAFAGGAWEFVITISRLSATTQSRAFKWTAQNTYTWENGVNTDLTQTLANNLLIKVTGTATADNDVTQTYMEILYIPKAA